MKSIEELRAGQWGDVQVGDIWQHHKGGLYEVRELGYLEQGCVPAVTYKNLDDGIVWTRFVSEWTEMVNVPLDAETSLNVHRFVLHARLW